MTNLVKRIESLLGNAVEQNSGSWHSFHEVVSTEVSDEERTVELFFEKQNVKGSLYESESIIANIAMYSSYYIEDDKIDENRFYKFDIYGTEMIPYNHLIAQDEFCDVIRAIAKITGRKYTFHSCGEPMFTITPEKTISWTEM